MNNRFDKLISLFRYWLYAERIKRLFDKVIDNVEPIKDNIVNSKNPELTQLVLYISDYNIFRSYWYSALFVVLEGYKDDLKEKYDNIDNLWNEEYYEYLKSFRNGTFHYQKQIFPEKLFKVDKDQHFINWLDSIHNTFGKVLIAELNQMTPEKNNDPMINEIKEKLENDIRKINILK
jgi:hypothetical protein